MWRLVASRPEALVVLAHAWPVNRSSSSPSQSASPKRWVTLRIRTVRIRVPGFALTRAIWGSVDLANLAGERFALVDRDGGPGYNRAVLELCRVAGFDARVEPDPQGPMTWETAVRNGGAVGLTTRSSAVSTARGIALVDLSPPPPRFAIHLVTPTGRGEKPSVATFRALASALARRPPDQTTAR